MSSITPQHAGSVETADGHIFYMYDPKFLHNFLVTRVKCNCGWEEELTTSDYAKIRLAIHQQQEWLRG